MKNLWVDRKQIRGYVQHLVAKLARAAGGGPMYLDRTAKPLKTDLEWDMDEDMIVERVGLFDARDGMLLWSQFLGFSVRIGDTVRLDFSKCHITLPNGKTHMIGDML